MVIFFFNNSNLKFNLNCNRHEESFIWIDACTDPKNVTVIHHVNETDQHLYHKIFNMGENGTENMSLICKTARGEYNVENLKLIRHQH